VLREKRSLNLVNEQRKGQFRKFAHQKCNARQADSPIPGRFVPVATSGIRVHTNLLPFDATTSLSMTTRANDARANQQRQTVWGKQPLHPEEPADPLWTVGQDFASHGEIES